VQSGAVIIILSFSFVVFCLFSFACVVVLQHYVVNKEDIYSLGRTGHTHQPLFLSENDDE